jgi:hypothetical protein
MLPDRWVPILCQRLQEGLVWQEREYSLSSLLFTFLKNNQFQNILTLYYINNFFITTQIKKFTTIQFFFFIFLYKFILFYIKSIHSYYYQQPTISYQRRPKCSFKLISTVKITDCSFCLHPPSFIGDGDENN